MVVKRLKWYRWGSSSTRGRSRYAYVNDCSPNCAEGKFHRYRVRLVLKRVRRCESSGRKVFTSPQSAVNRLKQMFDPR